MFLKHTHDDIYVCPDGHPVELSGSILGLCDCGKPLVRVPDGAAVRTAYQRGGASAVLGMVGSRDAQDAQPRGGTAVRSPA